MEIDRCWLWLATLDSKITCSFMPSYVILKKFLRMSKLSMKK